MAAQAEEEKGAVVDKGGVDIEDCYQKKPLTKEEIHQRCSLILTNFYHFNRNPIVTKDKVAFQNEVAQLKKLVDDIENTRPMNITNPCNDARILTRKPFFLLEAVQLDRVQTDVVLENLQKVIESILTEIAGMCE